MTTFTNKQLSTIEQTGFIGNVNGNDVFAVPYGDKGESEIILHKGGDVLTGLAVTTRFPEAYALFLIKNYNASVTVNPEQVARKDRVPMTTSTRREVEEAISRFNLGVSGALIIDNPTAQYTNNTMSIEEVICTLDEDYRFSPMASLKGSVTWSAANLCCIYLATTAKAIAAADESEANGLDKFNKAMGYLRTQDEEDRAMEDMGLEAKENHWATLRSLLMYSNKLNLDMQDLLDPKTSAFPDGRKRSIDPNAVLGYGVTMNSSQRRASWKETITKLGEADIEKQGPKSTETYAQYVELHGEASLPEESWAKLQVVEDPFSVKYKDTVLDVLMDVDGTEEADFDELPERTQIYLIESMRGKIPHFIKKTVDRIAMNRTLGRAEKTAEATKASMLINGFDLLFRSMLASSRYACFTEHMKTFAHVDATTKPETRRMRAKNEVVRDKVLTDMKTNSHDSADFLDLEDSTL